MDVCLNIFLGEAAQVQVLENHPVPPVLQSCLKWIAPKTLYFKIKVN
jgi:hypothetical protein